VQSESSASLLNLIFSLFAVLVLSQLEHPRQE